MSRYIKHKTYDNHTIWINKPKRRYIVTTAQRQFVVDRFRLDYKQTIVNLKKAGYTNINISCVGYTRKGV